MSKKLIKFKFIFEDKTEINKIFTRHPSESVEYFILKTIAFLHNYSKDLEINPELCHGELPDLFLKKNSHLYHLWIEIGGNLSKVKKNLKKTVKFKVYMDKRKDQLIKLKKQSLNLELIQIRYDAPFLKETLINSKVIWNIEKKNDKILINGSEVYIIPI